MIMGTGLEDRSFQQFRATSLEKLDNAVCVALANVADARKALNDALADCAATGTEVPQQVTACVEAADEHAGYGGWREARMLLPVRARLVSRVRHPMVVPAPSTPGDVVLGR